MSTLEIKAVCTSCGTELDATIETTHFEVIVKIDPCDYCKEAATCADCARELTVSDVGEVTPCPHCTCTANCNEETKKLMGHIDG